MKEDYQKALKKQTLFFLLKPIPFYKESYQEINIWLKIADTSFDINAMVTYFYIAKGYIIVTGNNNKLVNCH